MPPPIQKQTETDKVFTAVSEKEKKEESKKETPKVELKKEKLKTEKK